MSGGLRSAIRANAGSRLRSTAMGLSRFSRRVLGVSLLVGTAIGGCHSGGASSSVSTKKLAAHQAYVERDGLAEPEAIGALKVTAAAPEEWVALKMQKTPLYAHQQWRSP